MEKIEGVLLQDGSIATPDAGEFAAGVRVSGIRAGSVQLLEMQAAEAAKPRITVPHGDLIVGWADEGETRLRFDGGETVIVPAGRPFYASTGKDKISSVVYWDSGVSGLLLRLPYADVFVGIPAPALPCGEVGRAASLIEPAKAFLKATVASQAEPSAIASYALEQLTAEMLVAVFLDAEGLASLLDGAESTMLDKALAVIHSQAKNPELNPTRLASIMGVSLRTLHREFQSNHLSVAAAIRIQRVANARAMLERPGQAALPLERIAARAGFTTVVTMTRAFLSSGLETPAKFRRTVLTEQRMRRLCYA